MAGGDTFSVDSFGSDQVRGAAAFGAANTGYRATSIARVRDMLDIGLGFRARLVNTPSFAVDLTFDATASPQTQRTRRTDRVRRVVLL